MEFNRKARDPNQADEVLLQISKRDRRQKSNDRNRSALGRKPEAYDVGATSWSVDDNRTCAWNYMRLAEGNE